MNKHGIRLITAVVTSSMIVTPVLAAPSVDDLKKEKAAKQSEVSSLQSQLTTLMGKVNTLESELIQTGEDITKAQGDLEVAQEKEKEQYAAMKKRIKYMYEAGNDSAFETLVTSEDFTDLLSKAEYVQNVHSYDRKQLQEYVETKQQISDLKDSLEKDQKELESKQVEYEKQGDNLNNLITSKSAEVANLDSEIQAAAEAAAREAAERAAREAAEKAAKEAERQQAAASNNNAYNKQFKCTSSNKTVQFKQQYYDEWNECKRRFNRKQSIQPAWKTLCMGCIRTKQFRLFRICKLLSDRKLYPSRNNTYIHGMDKSK